MSAAAPTAEAVVEAPAKKGKKKLIIIIAAALVLLLVAGGATMFLLKKKHPVEGAEEVATQDDAHHSAKPDLKHPPTFLPLDPFIVNLADKDADRYAQVGITLEIEDPKFADQLKAYMPAIRNGILMILAHKNSHELLERSGKEQLAAEIQREAARTMGFDADEPPADAHAAAGAADDADATSAPKTKAKAKPKPKPKEAKPAEPNPIRKVHFSNFIIQ